MVTTRKDQKGRRAKISRSRKSSKIASGSYSKAAKEPWVLVTNLPAEKSKAVEIVNLYGKRMQIEEAFRAIKSHQFGLSSRYIQTLDVYRWAILLLLASIVLISYWVIGIIGHSQGLQKYFQPNTTNKRIYSYFTLGRLIIELDKLSLLKPLESTLARIISMELNHA